jgi:hypothetical protein
MRFIIPCFVAGAALLANAQQMSLMNALSQFPNCTVRLYCCVEEDLLIENRHRARCLDFKGLIAP